MFEELKQAFREAVDNFHEELNRDQIPGTVDRLLAGMREEVTDAKAHLSRLEDDIRRALKRAAREGEEVETCRRRERMARKIGDEETARVAREFGEKHEKRKAVLERKALALQEELDLRRAEVEEMLDRIREARTKREGLTAAAGRTDARESLRDADDLFADLDRMAERIADTERRAQAAEELGDLDDVSPPGPEAHPGSETDVEERLRELKRRLGKE